MEGDTNKRSNLIFWVLGVFFIVAIATAIILTYSYTSNYITSKVACGKSSANPLFVINTSELPDSYWENDYSYTVGATLVGARTNLTATFSDAPIGMKFDPCVIAYNTDVAPTPNTTIRCTLEGFPTVLYPSGLKITSTFSAPDLKKTIQKDFTIKVIMNPNNTATQSSTTSQ